MAIDLSPMVEGGVWLQSSTEAPPTYVTHQSHITRLTLEGWRPVPDPRAALLAQQAMQKAAEEQAHRDHEEAMAKEIADLKALVQSLTANKVESKTEDAVEEGKKQTTRRKAE